MKSIHVEAQTLPEAWETAVRRCWTEGARFRTQYDKPGDPPSRDVACLIHVKAPFSEPRIHRAFPGGLDDLTAAYQQRRRSLSADVVGARSATHSGTVRHRL